MRLRRSRLGVRQVGDRSPLDPAAKTAPHRFPGGTAPPAVSHEIVAAPPRNPPCGLAWRWSSPPSGVLSHGTGLQGDGLLFVGWRRGRKDPLETAWKAGLRVAKTLLQFRLVRGLFRPFQDVQFAWPQTMVFGHVRGILLQTGLSGVVADVREQLLTAMARTMSEVSHPLLPRRQCPRIRVRFENSWQGYRSESDSRQGYASDGPLSRNSCSLETGDF